MYNGYVCMYIHSRFTHIQTIISRLSLYKTLRFSATTNPPFRRHKRDNLKVLDIPVAAPRPDDLAIHRRLFEPTSAANAQRQHPKSPTARYYLAMLRLKKGPQGVNEHVNVIRGANV